jgi:hypothetical protein
MPLSKPRLVAAGLACAGLGAITLGYAAPKLTGTQPGEWRADAAGPAAAARDAATAPANVPVRIAETGDSAPPAAAPAPQREGRVRVDAPHTGVAVDKESGKVAVRAPYTDVRVDPDKGRVRVRAPYVDLDIRW